MTSRKFTHKSYQKASQAALRFKHILFSYDIGGGWVGVFVTVKEKTG